MLLGAPRRDGGRAPPLPVLSPAARFGSRARSRPGSALCRGAGRGRQERRASRGGRRGRGRGGRRAPGGGEEGAAAKPGGGEGGSSPFRERGGVRGAPPPLRCPNGAVKLAKQRAG